MATQNYRSRLESEAGENRANPTSASNSRAVEMGFQKGNPTAGKNRTPAPTRPANFDPTAKDRTYGRTSYGANAFSGPSSIEPGTRIEQGGINIDPPDGDPAKDQVIAKGVGARNVEAAPDAESYQTRPIPKSNVPDHPFMASNRSRQPSNGKGGTIPAKLGGDTGDAAARRQAGLDRIKQ